MKQTTTMNYTSSLLKCLLVFGFALLWQTNYAQDRDQILNKEVSITFDDLSIEESLAKLEKEVGVNTAYNKNEIKADNISITFEKELLSEVLEVLLANDNLSYKLIGNTITIFRSQDAKPLIAKTKKIEKFTLSGYVMDGESKETLIGATVYINEISKGITTNEYGFYSITLPEGSYEITYSFLGFETKVQQIDISENVEFSPLMKLGNTLDEVVISDDAIEQRHAEARMSTNTLSMEKLKSIPVLMGERDVIRMIQLMPGIQSGSEGSTGLYVRGGGPDQNLILLDGVPIYNVNHLFGFLSTLNGDAIKSAEVIKGGFPAQHGGRLSSIIDVRMKEGNMSEIKGDVTLGIVAGKINLEGPIVSDKTSFNISARRTWLDAITSPLQKISSKGSINKELFAYKFYDLNAKVNHKFSDKSRLYFSSYLGDDHMKYRGEYPGEKEVGDMVWGNKIYSLRWNYQLSPKMFSNTTVYNTQYKFTFDNDFRTTDGNGFVDIYSSKSSINDYGAKVDLSFLPNPNHHIRFGISAIQHEFKPTVNTTSYQQGSEVPKVNTTPEEKINGTEISAYVGDDMNIGGRLKVNAGIHASDYIVQNSNYFTLQPRAAMSFLINDKSSLKLSYSQMRQFLHLLASPGLGFPTDLWVSSTDRIKPESSTQYAIGYTHSLGHGFEATVEGYYKTMSNLIEYKSGFSFFSSGSDWEDKVLIGDGDSYGIELLLEKRIGKMTGWIGYTWSKSNRTFPDLNQGKKFPYKYDRRNDASLALTYKKSDRIDFGLIWVYGSGNTYTLGTKNYSAISAVEQRSFPRSLLAGLQPLNHVENRNNQRAPAYHRLDLSVNFHKVKKRGTRTWSVGFYNAYSRQNPFQITLEQRRENDELYLKQQSLLPILPFVSYSFKF